MNAHEALLQERFGGSVWWSRPPEPQTDAARRRVRLAEEAELAEIAAHTTSSPWREILEKITA